MLESSPSAGDPLIGRVIADRYRVVSLIGEGGMGRVYLADQLMGTTTRRVALKVLATRMAEAEATARFYRECEAVVQLEHANIIRFYDFGQVTLGDRGGDPRLYIVMEYVDGPTLAELIARGPMELATVDRLVRQIGAALGEAHRRGIVHRDLKPENVLVATDAVEGPVAKVLDFGIAKMTTASSEVTRQGTILGTPPYMSPEQVTGGVVDARTDVYALALITYEMVTGVRPFDARTPMEWAQAHTMRPPRAFDDTSGGRLLSASRRAAILSALEKDASRRTDGVLRFVREFVPEPMRDSSVASTPTPTVRAPIEPTTALPVRRGPLVAVAVGVIGLLGVAIVLGLWEMAGTPQPGPPTPSSMPPVTASMIDAGPTVATAIDAGPALAAPTAVDAGMPVTWLGQVHHARSVRDVASALGAPDGQCAVLEPHAMLTLELPVGRDERPDGTEAPELSVVLGDSVPSGPYVVELGVNHDSFHLLANEMIGTAWLDADPSDVPYFHFVRLQNHGPSHVCLDAVAIVDRP
jgi:serine/threonine-protein kinase